MKRADKKARVIQNYQTLYVVITEKTNSLRIVT